MSQKEQDESVSSVAVFWVVMGFVVWGAGLWLLEWWEVHRVVVLQRLRMAGIVVLSVLIVVMLLLKWWFSRSGGVGGKAVGSGWADDDREVVMVAPAVDRGGRGRPAGLDPRRMKTSPVLEPWPHLLRQAGRWSGSSRGVVRVLWARDGEGLVFGVSVDRDLGRSMNRAVGSVWLGARVEPWPLDDEGEVSDRVPIGEEGGGTVVRRYLVPENLCYPLETPSGRPDHPMAGCLMFWLIIRRWMCSCALIWCLCHLSSGTGFVTSGCRAWANTTRTGPFGRQMTNALRCAVSECCYGSPGRDRAMLRSV